MVILHQPLKIVTMFQLQQRNQLRRGIGQRTRKGHLIKGEAVNVLYKVYVFFM